jgi:dTMP kinase
MSGRYIVLEGVDGSGKSSAVTSLVARLRAEGRAVVRVKEPTDGGSGWLIREAARNGHRFPVADEAALFEMSRATQVRRVIRPALTDGAIVVSDRSYFAGAAYESVREGGRSIAEIIAHNETFAPRPDLVLYLRLPVHVALSRLDRDRDAFETADALERVAGAYDAMIGPGFVAVDAVGTVEEVAGRVWGVVSTLLAR